MAKRKRSYHVGKNNNLRSKSLRAHFRRKIPAVALDHTYAAYARDPYSVAGKSSRARLASDFRESMCYDVNHDTPIIKEEISREILTGSDFQDEDNNKDNRYKLGYSPLDSPLIIKEEEEEEEVPSTSGTDPLQFVKQEGESECSQHRNESFPLRYSPGYSPLIIKEEAREEVSSTSGTSPLPFIDQEGKSENFQDRNGSFPLRYSPSIIIKEEAGEENPSTSGTNPLLDQEGESEDFQHRNGSFSLRESPTMYYDLNHDTPIIKEEISTNSDFQDEDKEYNFEYSPLIIKEEAREEVPSTPGTDRLQFVEQEGGSENFQHRNGSFTLRVNEHANEIERIPRPDSAFSKGNRIVDLEYVMQTCMELQFEHSKYCALGLLKMDHEIRNGLTSIVVFQCNMCDFQTQCYTQKDACILHKVYKSGKSLKQLV